MEWLTIPFFIVAFAYSSVGLGGGSSYTALLAVFGFSVTTIPLVSLTLNLMVTSIGSYHFLVNKHGRWRLILPFLVSSMPMAYLGGSLHLPQQLFHLVLLISLVFVAIRIYLLKETKLALQLTVSQKITASIISGAVLGLVAGIAGIGGGVYLVPLIILLGLGSAKEAAACGVIFIWLNSLSGFVARIQFNTIDLIPFVPLIIAVIVGGWLGSFLGATRFSKDKMEKLLGVIILVSIFLLVLKLLNY